MKWFLRHSLALLTLSAAVGLAPAQKAFDVKHVYNLTFATSKNQAVQTKWFWNDQATTPGGHAGSCARLGRLRC